MSQKETRTVSATGGQKGVKPWRYDMIPTTALHQLATLYGHGAKKYDEHNFRKGYDWDKSYGGLQRHANLFWSGEDFDLELENVNHICSTAWHAFALTEFFFARPEYDNREMTDKPAYDTVEAIPQKTYPMKHVDFEAETRLTPYEPRYDLIPLKPLALLAEFYGKHHDSEQRKTAHLWSSYYAKIQEHANRFWSGENYDPTTGTLHTVLVAYYCFELLHAYTAHPESDDRLTVGASHIGFDSAPEDNSV